ncbi:MAG: 3',5'-cyclic-nucleotide phosphodiesterase [Gammaproteobacteria bacterium]|uniref:3',5'-cyclic-nucleotide phosphodiesterase n=1 Tax=Rhodoferax sp. TaxID=50421 RepID=UPI0017B22D79|nr:3',5'-cyclic-nucleotide phosphodiesterase [Rhodoferax sp.]MBU3898280.1 3',5'-cyclic-nucleotide phosphodiesterase [Gammaproteobacteria bacterium]MBA3059022.1 3',5'-cyclic-nucleotide phosphodiesterase [Rhodoferax sp.]MBU4081465.1 3',5'-cyclic-nucleotide phosphodiesterase [Gammaproteobacteria bacterium]MBU4114244.1 3',5'-cyclic-nucleotide phosphodiesterase [Gammaproteobacteria bacterium]MBU4170105.1 3',5'-cyclic-nucleotide phosphodiesterase [Gammaproteobacteria bacterium]
MKVRVLGCSGAIAKDCRTTSFLIDADVLIDAGTGVGDLTLDQMCGIEHVLLTHSHLDHVLALPLMVDATAARRRAPVHIHALAGTIAALKAHIFNDVIWPDFSRIPTPEAPFISFHEIQVGQTLQFGRKLIEVLPAVHTVPAVGFAVTEGNGCWVFTGDTERNPAFWERLNQLNVLMLVIETAFSNREKELARRSLHLSPHVLADELDCIERGHRYPIYITHTKPFETELIMAEIQRFDETQVNGPNVTHDIRWLRAGQEFDL